MTGACVRALGLGLLLSALASSGCLYVNIERGGKPHQVQFSSLAPGSLSETVNTDFLSSWQAVHAALWDLNMNIVAESRTVDNGAIECVTQGNERVRIELDGRAGPNTAVNVSWMTLQDRTVSRQILDRINTRVAGGSTPAAGTPVSVIPAVANGP